MRCGERHLRMPVVAAMKASLACVLAAVLAASTSVAAADEGPPPYRVVDGSSVDAQTLEGWRTWRAMACERCHGNEQQGLVGPALTQSLKTMSKEEFKATLINGRPERGMPTFGNVPSVVKNLDGLYGFLKGRADGAIKPGRLQALKEATTSDTKLTRCPSPAASSDRKAC